MVCFEKSHYYINIKNMFEHKFIGKSIATCGVKASEWDSDYGSAYSQFSDWTYIELNSGIIINAKLKIQYESGIWVNHYIVVLNLYTTTGKVYTFYNIRTFKIEQEALNYFKYR